MNKKLTGLILVLLTTLFITGCVKPIHNVHDSAVMTVRDVSMSKDQVKRAIIKAGVHRGWKMREVKSGHIIATLDRSNYMAQIDIKYTEKKYSLTYKNSRGLNYDGTNIHRNYNNWIIYLDRAIQVYLDRMK
ncbi:MAG: hypothetical protein OEW89_03265 [Gammaproteobacteria bacterium]|nr:hypothetical protein [Gammaproteobacteria bacterium]MDH5592793.1 hypothetical protein [Gammaproteobacteria bacterium]